MPKLSFLIACIGFLCSSTAFGQNSAVPAQDDWVMWGGDSGATHFSRLTQITPANVGRLRQVWEHKLGDESNLGPAATGDTRDPNGGGPPEQRAGTPDFGRGGAPTPEGAPAGRGGFGRRGPRGSELSPLVVGKIMYVTTPYNTVAALDADTGREIWKTTYPDTYGPPAIRGVAYWLGDGHTPPAIFFGTNSGYLMGLTARTGKPLEGFGNSDGAVHMEMTMENGRVAAVGTSSAPSIYKNLIIMGSHTQESPVIGPPGDVKAYDAKTGKLVWTFHSIPRPGEAKHDTWTGDSWKNRSGANVWGTITIDQERGIAYLPFGCVTVDYDGRDRPGLDLYGNSLVAVDAATGKLMWYFQTTHHDLWDYDLNAPPALIDITVKGKKIPAVAQMTKHALLFVLNRVTGEPVYGVEERKVPIEGFQEGETPWPTQPFPVRPAPLARLSFSPSELAKITPEHDAACAARLTSDVITGDIYHAFDSKSPGIFFPSTIGGGLWAGVAYDPSLNYAFVNTMDLGDQGRHGGGNRFWDQNKWPCQAPPWGRLTAIDMSTGDFAWQVPLGSFPELEKLGMKDLGTPNVGGPMATASGLVFIAGTLDNKMRAFDSKTGKVLWTTDLPAAAHNVPVTYRGRNGKQYVALVVGGGGVGFMGDTRIVPVLKVYALP